MANSDNSASDTLLQTVNGPAYVTKRMHALGFKNIVINRSIIEMMMDTNHVHPALKKPRTVQSWKKYLTAHRLSKKCWLGSVLKRIHEIQRHLMKWQNC
ncbi:serine hydrolase [Legionella tunisiensis]|uniref:serine hydrolase n=1 Tax=Legionella tunisiensis TaxID=1034944 RepID=UPI0022B2CBE9|nr:serine hydrolase [Legionella tunisiensis]